MARWVFMNLCRRWLVGWCAVLAILVAGCITDAQKRGAIDDINNAFRAEYEAILAHKGTRVYKVTRAEAYDAVRVSLARLGMIVEAQDPVLGYVNVYAPAPRPLNREEWEQAAEADRPRAREIIGPTSGYFAISSLRADRPRDRISGRSSKGGRHGDLVHGAHA